MKIQDNQIKVTPVFTFEQDLGFEAFIIELLPGHTHLSSPHQDGVIEHIIAISGTVEVLTGQIWQKIEKNGGLRFAADIPHGYRNLSDSSVVFHNIIHYKK